MRKEEIDEVYYGEFEPVSEFYENPEAVLDNAEGTASARLHSPTRLRTSSNWAMASALLPLPDCRMASA